MFLRSFLYILFLAALAYYSLLLYESRKPLCIDSKYVEKIDRLGDADVSTVYKCSYRQLSENRSYFEDKILNLHYRIQKIEKFISEVGALQAPVQIVIIANQPQLFQVLKHKIYIGEKLAFAEGHLEKALLKIWYRERDSSNFIYKDLAEEVATDFMLFLATGKMEIHDPFSEEVLGIEDSEFILWPQVLKSGLEYCKSSWKISEHYDLCNKNIDSIDKVLQSKPYELSLRPLLAKAWIGAYGKLSLNEKHAIEQSLNNLVISPRQPELPIIDLAVHANSPLSYTSYIISVMSQYLSNGELIKFDPAFNFFLIQISKELQKLGFGESQAILNTDILFWTKESTEILDNLLKLSRQDPHTQIVMRTPDKVILLPSKFSMNLDSIKEIRTRSLVIEHCGRLDFDFIYSFENFADKLLIIENCNEKSLIDYSAFTKEGTAGFARANKKLSFIQFHLPSLSLRKDLLQGQIDIFNLIANRDSNNPLVQALGWQELEWKEQIGAYQPKAEVEAIQFFRVLQGGLL